MKKAYTIAAYTTFNCIVVLILVNLLLGGVFHLKDWIRNPHGGDARVSAYREKFADYEAYSRMTRAEVETLLDEQDAMGAAGLRYKPWVQFRNPEVSGQFLNTDSEGFRTTRRPQPREGDPFKVYVFGGSTTFGYGVADHHTIPSYLQKVLEERHPHHPILVRNFGQAFYYSSQEQLVLMSLLKSGDVPDLAVFVDGGNDMAQLALQHDEPIFTPALTRLWNSRNGHGARSPAAGVLSFLPMMRLAKAISKRLGVEATPYADEHRLIKSDADLAEAERARIANYVVERYLANLETTRAICRQFEVDCLFVWQPHPSYKYDSSLHKTFPFEGPVPDYQVQIGARMEAHRDQDYLYLGDLMHRRSRKAYVDDVHYNEEVNELIAERIGTTLRLDPNPSSTGANRL